MACEHDPRFGGVFDLPLEANGCLACFAEQQAEQISHLTTRVRYLKELIQCAWLARGMPITDESIEIRNSIGSSDGM